MKIRIMKLLQYLLFFVVLTGCADSQTIAQENTNLFISAPSGLKLRATPNLSAKVVGVGAYGQAVQLLEKNVSSEQTIEGVSGYWYLVKLEGKEGFMFSGFLKKEDIKAYKKKSENEFSDTIKTLQKKDIPVSSKQSIDNIYENGEWIGIKFNKSKKVINTYLLREQNPYNALPFKIEKELPDGGRKFKYSSDSNLSLDFFLSGKPSTDKVLPFILETSGSIYTKGKTYTAAAYNLLVFNEHFEPIGYRGSADILDKNGKTLNRFEHLDVNIWQFLVTQDGKYFIFTYGGILTEDGTQLTPDGWRIYNVQSKELLYENILPSSEKLTKPIMVGDKVIMESKVNFYKPAESKRRFTIVDLNTMKDYFNDFDMEIRKNLIDITEEALIFKSETDGKKIIYNYKKDFSQ